MHLKKLESISIGGLVMIEFGNSWSTVRYLADVVEVSVGHLLLGCQLLHLVQQDVHLELGAQVLQTPVAEGLPVHKARGNRK